MKTTGNNVSVFRFAFHSRPREGRVERRHEDDADRLGRRSCWVGRKAMCDLIGKRGTIRAWQVRRRPQPPTPQPRAPWARRTSERRLPMKMFDRSRP